MLIEQTKEKEVYAKLCKAWAHPSSWFREIGRRWRGVGRGPVQRKLRGPSSLEVSRQDGHWPTPGGIRFLGEPHICRSCSGSPSLSPWHFLPGGEKGSLHLLSSNICHPHASFTTNLRVSSVYDILHLLSLYDVPSPLTGMLVRTSFWYSQQCWKKT